jgi:hypothetical protein
VEFRDTLKLLPISEWTALRLTLRRAFGGVASGLRVSASVSLILTITIEMFAPGSWEYGIGQLIRLAETNGDYDGIYAAIILLMILGYTLNAATHALVQVSTAPAKVDPDASPARREDLEMYLPEGLRGLPEQAIRVLTVDQVTETLMEIYAARGVAFELLDCQVSPDNVARRVVRFTAGSPPQPLLIGGATVYLDAMEHALGDSPDTWLSVRRELDRRSLGLIVRDHLGARVVYEDSSLELMSRPSRGTSPAAKRSAELPGRVVRRCREIRAAGGRALLANIEEFVAIDVIAGRPVATEGPTHISRAS